MEQNESRTARVIGWVGATAIVGGAIALVVVVIVKAIIGIAS